jgi:UDP-glucose 4-epimerase
MEKVMIAKSRLSDQSGTVICATRYGNVMASRGSVIPLFVEQIRKGVPITITDPKMTRFLVSLDESVELVLYAFKNAKPGDIFVQKAPSSTIGDLAQALRDVLSASGQPKIIGTRHGEKLFETLVSREEMERAEELGQYYRIPADTRDLNYDKYFVEGKQRISRLDDYTSHNTEILDVEAIKKLLLGLEFIREAIRA